MIYVLFNTQKSAKYLPDLLNPVLKGFKDKEYKVQLAACDAMFNIIKICKEAFLQYKEFLTVFNEIINLLMSVNTEVKEWAKKVDELLKDIVYKTLIK